LRAGSGRKGVEEESTNYSTRAVRINEKATVEPQGKKKELIEGERGSEETSSGSHTLRKVARGSPS